MASSIRGFTDAVESGLMQPEHSCHVPVAELLLRLSSWIQRVVFKIALDLTLWPLKFLYRQPEPTWQAWFANQKMCQLDRRYC